LEFLESRIDLLIIKTTGPGRPQIVRMHDQQIAAVDASIAMQENEISRPEAKGK
jgi:hypothetical protein